MATENEKQTYTFVLSTEALNSRGCRILLEGMRLKNFKRNPIMLYGHIQSWRDTKNIVLPIGYWENIRIEDGKLMADAVFDQEDSFAKQIESKVRQKVLRACSVGVSVITTSEDPKYLVPGQSRPTIIECDLREASIVDFPANKDCIVLYDGATDKELNMSDNSENFLLPLLSEKTNKNDMDFKQQVLTALALDVSMSNEAAVAAISEKAKAPAGVSAAEHDKVKTELKVLQDEKAASFKAGVETYLSDAVKARKITEAEKAEFLEFAATAEGFERVKKLVDPKPAVEDLSDKGAAGADAGTPADPWAARFAEIEKNNSK